MITVFKPLKSHLLKSLLYHRIHTFHSVLNMNLREVVSTLKDFAPLHLAEDWDNVGLLVEPSSPAQVTKMMLTNDLTEPVLLEALGKQVQMIITYHPIIFSPLKRLTQSSWKERILINCLENKIAIYSPHTSWDAVIGGINDWLLKPFDISKKLVMHGSTSSFSEVEVTVDVNSDDKLGDIMAKLIEKRVVQKNNISAYDVVHGNQCSKTFEIDTQNLQKLLNIVMDWKTASVVNRSGMKKETFSMGCGRYAELKNSIPLKKAVELVKEHLKLDNVMLAVGMNKSEESLLSSVAVCAGAGSSVLQNSSADLLLTGEMSHHSILDATARGSSVLLTCHTNSERGFLTEMAHLLKSRLSGVEIFVSEKDKDPLVIV